MIDLAIRTPLRIALFCPFCEFPLLFHTNKLTSNTEDFMPAKNDLYDIQQRVIELYTQAERHFLKRFKRPYIRLDLRGECAGQAWPQKYQLRFNPVLLKENREHFLQQTVAHEVAHLLTHELFGSRVQAHGKEWQSIMESVFTLPADRCHTYDTGNSSRKPWLYQCHCEGKLIALSTIRHNRSRKGAVYLCTSCKTPLTFVKKVEPQPRVAAS